MDLKWLYRKLVSYYGTPESPLIEDRVRLLVKTILSQNTNDKNRDLAMKRLEERINSIKDLLDMENKEIYSAIKVAGLGNIKSERIKNSLKKIKKERGEITLEFLEEMSLKEAREYLSQLPGVGFKTSSVILNFGFDKPAFPVDTHCERVLKRLGVVEDNKTPEKVTKFMEKELEDGKEFPMHINLIKHGRKICKAPEPPCEDCFLTERCEFYLERKGTQ